jgi:glyoxylase-like metal-dependent hydrolase (beta-lactamase superfamily II)
MDSTMIRILFLSDYRIRQRSLSSLVFSVQNGKKATFATKRNISMQLIPLIADNWKMDGGVAFGVVPKSIWSRLHTADENNCISITTRCLLIVHNQRKILIDVGLGDKQSQKYYSVRFRQTGINIINSLEQAGFSPNDITDVLFTHLHDDHVGAATHFNQNGEIECVFPNAQYWVSQSQWDWAINPNKRESAAYFKENLIPLLESGRLHLLNEGEQPFENFTLRLYNGHTRGQIIPLIQTKQFTLVYMGDFIPTKYNIPIPFIPAVDIEPLVSLLEKEQFLKEAADNKFVLFFEHDTENECCTVAQSEKGVVAEQSFKLNEIESL